MNASVTERAEQVVKAWAPRDIGYCYACRFTTWFWLDDGQWRCGGCDRTNHEAYEVRYYREKP